MRQRGDRSSVPFGFGINPDGTTTVPATIPSKRSDIAWNKAANNQLFWGFALTLGGGTPTATGMAADPSYIYTAGLSGINILRLNRGTNISDQPYSSVAGAPSQAYGVAIDSKFIYTCDESTQKAIFRAPITGGAWQQIIGPPNGSVASLVNVAIDPLGKYIFGMWQEAPNSTAYDIYRYNYDGSGKTVLVTGITLPASNGGMVSDGTFLYFAWQNSSTVVNQVSKISHLGAGTFFLANWWGLTAQPNSICLDNSGKIYAAIGNNTIVFASVANPGGGTTVFGVQTTAGGQPFAVCYLP